MCRQEEWRWVTGFQRSAPSAARPRDTHGGGTPAEGAATQRREHQAPHRSLGEPGQRRRRLLPRPALRGVSALGARAGHRRRPDASRADAAGGGADRATDVRSPRRRPRRPSTRADPEPAPARPPTRRRQPVHADDGARRPDRAAGPVRPAVCSPRRRGRRAQPSRRAGGMAGPRHGPARRRLAAPRDGDGGGPGERPGRGAHVRTRATGVRPPGRGPTGRRARAGQTRTPASRPLDSSGAAGMAVRRRGRGPGGTR